MPRVTATATASSQFARSWQHTRQAGRPVLGRRPCQGRRLSPFGPLVAESATISRATRRATRTAATTSRSSRARASAPGGAYSYFINGRMIAGFAMVAYPDDYGRTGVMTFIVSHNGKVYEKDLGDGTAPSRRGDDDLRPGHRVEGSGALKPSAADRGNACCRLPPRPPRPRRLATASAVRCGFDRTADFTSYKTFGFASPSAPTALATRRAFTIPEDSHAARDGSPRHAAGHRRAATAGQLQRQPERQVARHTTPTTGRGRRPGLLRLPRRILGMAGVCDQTYVTQYKEGTLNIDVVDAARSNWSGRAWSQTRHAKMLDNVQRQSTRLSRRPSPSTPFRARPRPNDADLGRLAWVRLSWPADTCCLQRMDFR